MYVWLITVYIRLFQWMRRFADRWVLIRTDDKDGIHFHTLSGEKVGGLPTTPDRNHYYTADIYCYTLPLLNLRFYGESCTSLVKAEEALRKLLRRFWWGAVILPKDWNKPWPKKK